MREHINLFEQQNEEIHEFCKKYKIYDYTVTPEGVDVQGKVKIKDRSLHKLPFQFNVIHGDFNIEYSGLQTLENTPRVVHGYFDCSNNELQSLHDIPKFIKGVLYCELNNIEPWEYRYLLFSEIQGRIYTNPVELIKLFKLYQNQKSLIPQALKELREIQIQWEQMNARTY